ncbi:MAG: PHP domain-containing protein [Patescibacteria group bacterium]
MRCDLHIHSFASYDCLIDRKAILDACRKKKIQALAITDHNEIYGAIRLKRELPLKVIVGEEINTKEGEIIGLFLERKIEPGLSLKDTIEQIRLQKGLVYVPHLLDSSTGRRSSLTLKSILSCLGEIDILEVFNSRTFSKEANYQAQKLAFRYQKLMGAGSDAHLSNEIGLAGVEIEDFDDQNDFLKKLKRSTVFGKSSPFYVYLITKLIRFRKSITRR